MPDHRLRHWFPSFPRQTQRRLLGDCRRGPSGPRLLEGSQLLASCGWGGTLRLRAKVVDARDRGVKTAEKLVGQGLELG